MIRLTIPHIRKEEIERVARVLRSGYLTQGKEVEAFEEEIRSKVGAKHAIAVSSGTAALHLALLGLGIGRGDEVIVPDFTFPATVNVVHLVGATPIVVDINLETLNIDAGAAAAAITRRTKAIMPVHLFGNPADLDPLLALAKQHHLYVIEDAACALGSTYQGKLCGSIGDVGCFSFHPRKIITTAEGGMVVTDHDEVAEKIRLLRSHGLVRQGFSGHQKEIGFNYRLTDLAAAIGIEQMKRLPALLRERENLAKRYDEAFQAMTELRRPEEVRRGKQNYQSYVVLARNRETRDRLAEELQKRQIETTVGAYSVNLLSKLHARVQSQQAFYRSLTLPLYNGMTEEEINEVISTVCAA